MRFGIWLMLAAVVAGIWLFARRWSESGFDPLDFVHSLARGDIRWLLACLLLTVLSYYVRALRWMVLLEPTAPGARRRPVIAATFIGYTAVILFGRPGEFVRPYLIARSAQVSFFSQLAAWLLERIYDTLTVLTIFGYALAAVLESGRTFGPKIHWVLERGAWVTGVVCTVCLISLAVLHRFSDSFERRLRDALSFLQEHHQEKAGRMIRAGMDGLRSTRSFRSILLLFGYSALEWLVIFLTIMALFRAFPETGQLPPIDVVVYIGFVSFGSIVQIPGIGGGVQLVTVLVLSEFFGVALEPATGIALVSWLTTVIATVPVGAALAFHEGLSWSKIKEFEREAAL